MLKHTLFICKFCYRSSEDRPKDQPADGERLLAQLNIICAEQWQVNDFQIQPVGCL